jgi:hypothetical protein
LDSIPINVSLVAINTSRQGCRPPDQGKRTIASSSIDSAGQPSSALPEIRGSIAGRSRKKPNAFATRAAEDSGLDNFPLSISLPGAAA